MKQHRSDQPNKNMSERLTPEQRDWAQLAIADAANIAILQAECDTLRAQLEDLRVFCRDAQILAMEVVWGGKPGECDTPENIYTAGIGGIKQAFDMLRAKLENSERFRHEYRRESELGVQELKQDNAALRARCEQRQRENEALVHGAEAGPTR